MGELFHAGEGVNEQEGGVQAFERRACGRYPCRVPAAAGGGGSVVGSAVFQPVAAPPSVMANPGNLYRFRLNNELDDL